MNKNMKTKKKLARITKYDDGGTIYDPAYRDYLASIGKTTKDIESQNASINNDLRKQQKEGNIVKGVGAGVTGILGAINPVLGAAAGVVSGGLNNMINSDLQTSTNNEFVRQKLEQEQAQKYTNDKSQLGSLKGKEGIQFFNKLGGKLANPNSNVSGGNLVPLASNVDKVKGNNPSKTDDVSMKKNGQTFAKVDHNEVIVTNATDKDVLSDNVYIRPDVSFAQEGTRLGKEQGKLEKMNTDTSNFKLGRVKAKLALLPELQEKIKGVSDGDEVAYAKMGGKIPKYINGVNGMDDNTSYIRYNENGYPITKDMEFNNDSSNQFKAMANTEKSMNFLDEPIYSPKSITISPLPANQTPKSLDYGKAIDTGLNLARFADNAYNSSLINNTPQIAKPHLQQAANLETKINIEPNLTANSNAYSDFARNVDSTLSDSNVAAANKGAAYAKRLQVNNDLYSGKENGEIALRNQDKLNKQGVNSNNLAKLDNFDNQVYNRELMQQERKSANVTNAVEDLSKIGTERNLKALDNSRISHIARLYNSNTASAVALYKEYKNAAKTSDEKRQLKREMSGDATTKKMWNNDIDNQNDQI